MQRGASGLRASIATGPRPFAAAAGMLISWSSKLGRSACTNSRANAPGADCAGQATTRSCPGTSAWTA